LYAKEEERWFYVALFATNLFVQSGWGQVFQTNSEESFRSASSAGISALAALRLSHLSELGMVWISVELLDQLLDLHTTPFEISSSFLFFSFLFFSFNYGLSANIPFSQSVFLHNVRTFYRVAQIAH
jgi:hypothetical protein